MLTAGTAIGAGMFSLPVVSSGMWFIYSIGCLFLLWFLSYLCALYLLEANVHFSPGASFDTIVSNILGKTWNVIIGLSVAFLMYILLYAYYSAFGNIVAHTLDWELFKNNQWAQGGASLVLGGLLAMLVWLSTATVGRISTILVSGMVISFIVSMFGLALQVEASKLFNLTEQQGTYFPYLWASLPYFMTAFGIATIVPSLYKFYGKNPRIIQKSLLFGSLIALFVYALFLFVAFGNISRQAFVAINEAGGNIGQLINAFEQGARSETISFALTIFSNFAIITSFLAVGLGLFDYIADLFSFTDDRKGRFYTACITFLPPGIASFFFPNGFIAAIGFAGLVAIIGNYIAAYLMVWKTRKTLKKGIFRVWGGNYLLRLFMFLALLVGLCQILTMLGYLPQW